MTRPASARIRTAIAVLALALLALAPAGARAEAPEDPVSRLVEAVHFPELAEGVSRSFTGPPAAQLAETSPELAEAWTAAAPLHFPADGILADFRGILAAMAPATVAHMLAFAESDLGARIADAERAMADPEAVGELLSEGGARWDRLGEEDPARRALLREIQGATHAVEIGAMALSSFNMAMARGMLAAGGAGPRLGEAELAEACQCGPEAFRGLLQAPYDAIYAGAYAGFDNAELERYRDFLRMPASETYFAQFSGGYVAMLERRAGAFGEDVAARLLRERI
ncbi:hypothetical protein LNKW23_24210 [Paralimibaculum aggregatum]|uniref:DUF2059 domain-containing protein n=1 Tax=Paralimibaculum aggregatum TaxID=3036245 RepID=A0ABQ6LIU1_9RHOB|nr:hypothetical protein [Limibaculum sp. NKW23]GMG83208.1 hypothetical protein LNKW23_24210 [Limibaculum sp. NKW23]